MASFIGSETESFIIAAQDQSLPKRNFQASILENGADRQCRVCDKHTETIDHVVSGCPLLAPTEYLNRNDRLSQYIHWCLCKNFVLPHKSSWWEHKPPKVIKNKSATILLDFDIHTYNTTRLNRPDMLKKIIMIKPAFSLICLCLAIPIYHTKSLKN